MTIEKVILCRVKIWKTLLNNGRVHLSELPAVLEEKQEIASQALEWLEREDRIIYSGKNLCTYISLKAPVRSSNESTINLYPGRQKPPTQADTPLIRTSSRDYMGRTI